MWLERAGTLRWKYGSPPPPNICITLQNQTIPIERGHHMGAHKTRERTQITFYSLSVQFGSDPFLGHWKTPVSPGTRVGRASNSIKEWGVDCASQSGRSLRWSDSATWKGHRACVANPKVIWRQAPYYSGEDTKDSICWISIGLCVWGMSRFLLVKGQPQWLLYRFIWSRERVRCMVWCAIRNMNNMW